MDIRTLFSNIFILTGMINPETVIVIKDMNGKVYHNNTWLCKGFWEYDDMIAISFNINLISNTMMIMCEIPPF